MAKKILIPGAGHSQLDLIQAAKEEGWICFVAGGKEGEPGFAYADDYRVLDIRNRDALRDYAKEKDVKAIFTMGLEMALYNIESISEELGLPHFFSTTILDMLADKGQWRKALGDIPFRVGENVEEFLPGFYPAVIKPVDGSGQRGVFKVESDEEVKEFFAQSKAASKSGRVLMEEYIGGEEISVNTYLRNGELRFAMISDRISYSEYPGGIIKEHHIPSKYEYLREEILALVKRVCQVIGFQNGHIYFQLKIDQEKAKLIEFTPRYDGCHMWNLIFEATGLDLRKVSLEYLEGKNERLDQYDGHMEEGLFKTVFLSLPPKTIVRESLFHIPDDARTVRRYYKEGEQVKTVTGYMEKAGYYIVKEERP